MSALDASATTEQQLALAIQLLRTLADMVSRLADKVTLLESKLEAQWVTASQVQPEATATTSQAPTPGQSRAATPNHMIGQQLVVRSPEHHGFRSAQSTAFAPPGLALVPVEDMPEPSLRIPTPWGTEPHLDCNTISFFFKPNTIVSSSQPWRACPTQPGGQWSASSNS